MPVRLEGSKSIEISRTDEVEGKPEYDYFIDRFDLDSRSQILGIAAEFGAEAEETIFMLRKKKGTEGASNIEALLAKNYPESGGRVR